MLCKSYFEEKVQVLLLLKKIDKNGSLFILRFRMVEIYLPIHL